MNAPAAGKAERGVVLIKRVVLMGGSTALRLGAGVLSFVWMARELGVVSFGVFMFWQSVAILIALASNFGFVTYLLRGIGARPDSAGEQLSDVLTAKIVLAVPLLLGVFLGASFAPKEQRYVFLILAFVQIADTFAEALVVGLRARGLFGVDAKLTAGVSASQLICVATGMVIAPTLYGAVAAYSVARVIGLALSMAVVIHCVPGLRISRIRSGFRSIFQARAYAVDTWLQSMLGQIDSVVLNAYLGPAAVGVYQAGLRVFSGLAQVAPILANVLLPTVAAAQGRNAAEFAVESRRVQWTFSAAGLLFGMFLAFPSQYAVGFVFGPQFLPLAELLPWFGLLFNLRLFAGSWGVLLTASGLQGYRARCNLIMWVGVGVFATALVPKFGAIGWLQSLIFGHIVLSILYIRRVSQQSGVHWSQLAAGLACVLAFLPFLNFGGGGT